MTSDARISDLLKNGGPQPAEMTIEASSPDGSASAFNSDPQALMRLARTVNEKGMESGISTQGISAGFRTSGSRTNEQKSNKGLDDFIFLQTLELSRQMAELDARMAELSSDMDEVANDYLSSEEMTRIQGETEEQYRARQYQLMKAKHELDEVPDEQFVQYEESYQEWLRANEQKRELQKELAKPEHRQALREMGKHQQYLEARHLELTQRTNLLTQLFDDLKALKSIPEGADTAKDIAFMQLLKRQPEISLQLNSIPRAPEMTTDEKITALEQIAQQTRTVYAIQLEEVLQDENQLSVITSAEIGNSYAQQTDIEIDNTTEPESASSRATYFTSFKI